MLKMVKHTSKLLFCENRKTLKSVLTFFSIMR